MTTGQGLIGFESYGHQGPGIFLTRLQAALENRGLFSQSEPDVWVQLSFQPLPDAIAARKAAGKTKVMVRMDGAYCDRHHKIRKPWVLSIPGLDHWYSAKVNRKKNQRIRENLLAADGIVFQSEFSRRITQRFVTATQPGIVIYNGVDPNAFRPEGERSTIRQPERLNVLVSHSFRPYHRLHDSMRILARLRQSSGLRPFLHILGGDDGVSFAYAQSIADELGLQAGIDYQFHGKLPHTELASVYRACDLMLNLSYWDACPNVVIEALMTGLPVVGVNYGGVAELVGQRGGKLVMERIPFTWLEHRNFERMPKAPVEAYAQAIEAITQRLPEARAQARQLALETLTIERVGDEYIQAAQSLFLS